MKVVLYFIISHNLPALCCSLGCSVCFLFRTPSFSLTPSFPFLDSSFFIPEIPTFTQLKTTLSNRGSDQPATSQQSHFVSAAKPCVSLEAPLLQSLRQWTLLTSMPECDDLSYNHNFRFLSSMLQSRPCRCLSLFFFY